MLFDENKKKEIKIELEKNLISYEEPIKNALIFMILGGFLLSFPSTLSIVGSSATDQNVDNSQVFEMIENIKNILMLGTSLLGIGFIASGVFKIAKSQNVVEKKLSNDFKLESKNLIYYISLSSEYDNERLNNFIRTELKKIREDKKIIMQKNIKEKNFLENFKKFNSSLKSKEEKNLEKLVTEKKEINRKIKESEKILGKRTNNISISNE